MLMCSYEVAHAPVLLDEKVPGKQKSGRDAHFSQKGFLNSEGIISYSDS
jgi:hypothetical protein